jgi:hypothetical protein
MSEIYTYAEPKLHGSVQERMARMKFNVSKAMDKTARAVEVGQNQGQNCHTCKT